jgi:hypothetical protein
LKLLQENLAKTLKDTGISNDFLNRTPIAQRIRASLDKCDFIKLKTSVHQRKQLQINHTVGEKSSQGIYHTKD